TVYGGGRELSRSGVRPRGARERNRKRLYRRGPEARGRCSGQGGRTPRHELPVVPLLREEVQFALTISGGAGRHFLSARRIPQETWPTTRPDKQPNISYLQDVSLE